MNETDSGITALCEGHDPNELRGCWAFEQNLLDGSGNGNDAVGNVSFEAGVDGFAIATDVGNSLTVGADDSLDASPTWTVEAFGRLESVPYGFRAAAVRKSDHLGLVVTNNGSLRCRLDGVSVDDPSGTNLIDDSWHHLACSYDGTMVRVYLDGIETVASFSRAPSVPLGQETGIGARSDGMRTWQGAIDSVRIWSTVRSADEICAASGADDC